MKDYFLRLAVTTILGALEDAVLHSQFKPALLKVFKKLWAVFSTDPDFVAVVNASANSAKAQ